MSGIGMRYHNLSYKNDYQTLYLNLRYIFVASCYHMPTKCNELRSVMRVQNLCLQAWDCIVDIAIRLDFRYQMLHFIYRWIL